MKVSVMRYILSTVAALAVTGLVVASDESKADANSDVKVLTTETFKEWTAAQGLALIEFYAPWCGHCKILAPEYEKAATILKDENISLAKIDCTEAQALCEEMEIPGFPTLKISKNGDFATYNGTRKEDGIVSYMRKQLLPPLSVLSPDSFDKFTKSERVVVVGYVADEESPEYAELESLAKELRDEFTFGVVKSKKLAKAQGVEFPGVVVYKEFDDGKDVFDGKITADELRGFIKASSVPVFGEISAENYAAYAQAGLPFGFAFYDSEDTRKELEEQIYPVAKEYKGVISFVLIDAGKYSSQADHLNLNHEWPAFAIQNQTSLAKFPFPQDQVISKEAVESFVKDFAEGKLEPSYKSEAVPETNDGNVFVMVSDEFNKVTFDKTKDVLLEFYAPWCGHCKNLAPVYEKLGGILKQNKNLVIAKMDAIANDIPSAEPALQVGGFPTIVLVRGEDNTIVEYNGNRSLESLIEFIEENAANSITYDKDLLKDKEDEDEEEDDNDDEDAKDEDKPVVNDQAEAEAEAEIEVDAEEEPKAKNPHDEL
ncbi:protein disulfide-isomerase precursor [Coemansia sp. RSA 2322]|uniref:Protein disulfide-isomerase n=1 Tax=Coemansia thaxteri TaxID=2663907 RepID=A0A9W8BFH1_9FUNG|nr:protein disulfide-isomerase precursor [Coemansia thaxteri]KAJ2463031.1 protein disulfide-isomerase precursor [Coemansia sp. RSA 2322]KAJ2487055.1 protein disulfide-isomerase precursor [Coemansia sp. RSA 2320]